MNMKKFKFFFNLDKEEKWLNEKSNEGWELYDKKMEYKFRKTAYFPTIKIDYRTFKSKNDFQDYKTLFKDSGWEHIIGSKTSGKQYFKKTERNASTDIFSDNLLRIQVWIYIMNQVRCSGALGAIRIADVAK